MGRGDSGQKGAGMNTFRIVMMIIQLVAVLVLFADLLFVALQKPSVLQSPLLILLCSSLVMFLGYIMEVGAGSAGEALLGAAVSYLGKPFVMLSSWLFVCAFFNRKIPKWLVCVLSIFCMLFFWTVLTNRYHYLYYSSVGYDPGRMFSPLVLTHGPLYGFYIAATVLYFAECIVTVVRGCRQTASRRKKTYAGYIMAMVLCGLLGYANFLTDSAYGYDSTMLGVFFGTILLSIMFFRYRIYDVLSLAKDQALDDSTNGLLILDSSDNIVYTNSMLAGMLRKDLSIAQLKAIRTRNANISVGGRVYAVTKKELIDQDEYQGRAFEVQDITDMFNYHTRLEHDVKEQTNRIKAIQRSVIVAIAEVVEARNMETGEHTERTVELTRAVARELLKTGKYRDDLTEEYIEILSSAASLHDIGKITIPDSILLKPGPLTAEEFEQIKGHTIAGAKVIEKAMTGLEPPKYVKICQDVAKYHHEHWDGSGYPDGLSGNGIPLSARITAVADAYAAMTVERCYKGSESRENAVEAIREESGTHFDPEVVEAFLKVMDEENIRA